jgi:hypothetical protein
MARSTWRTAFAYGAAEEDDRPLRRDATSIAAGMVLGGGLGVLAGIAARPAAMLLTLAGAVAGGIAGWWIGGHVSAEEWDPSTHRSWVGAYSPEDDFADGG